ncbi:hypothetical protein ABZ599_13550 [Streptomyces misionensis]|uniref:hypothetical protein n=1 Tax=Streptomyces misionensis TaxID=67331 RepID=UPI0033C907A3
MRSAATRHIVVAAMASEADRRAHEPPATGAWAAIGTTAVEAAAPARVPPAAAGRGGDTDRPRVGDERVGE